VVKIPQKLAKNLEAPKNAQAILDDIDRREDLLEELRRKAI